MKATGVRLSITLLLFAILGLLSSVARADTQQTVFEVDSHSRTHGFTSEQVAQLGNTEKFAFQTEISRLMSLIINSLYKTREIFLRELISNASDALDKIRFIALTDPSALASEPELSISIAADPETNTLVITDTGVGMTKEQLKQNLGTIAKSGTSEFLAKLENNRDDVTQIGQFGVGFYSVFLVADKVTVASKSNDDPVQHIWMSEAVDDFVIAEDPRGNTLGRGTQITLHLKEDARKFLQQDTLRGLVSKYSEFINFPIYLWSSREETVVEEESAEDEGDEIKEEAIEDEAKEETKTVRTVHFWEQTNTQKPLWLKNPKDIEDSEYVDFYRSITKDTNGSPLSWTHYKGEGDVEFRSIIYIAPHADPNFFQNLAEKKRNIRLFVKRVFITDEFDLFPKWLSFLKGIVDADDLPLNVSRETLQKHRALSSISKHLVKKALEMFAQLAKNNKEKYSAFIKEYGSALKYGAIESNAYRKKIATLLRFPSSYDPSGPTVSLDDYISRMKANQKSIYYLAGMTVSEVEQSPFLESLLARGYEVLYMVDPMDEMLVQNMPGYNGQMFVSVAKGDLKFGDEDDIITEQVSEKFAPLQEWLNTFLSKDVEKVVISKRLTTSPMALVAANYGLTGHMERLMAAQGHNLKDADAMIKLMKTQKRTLEINAKHPIIEVLAQRLADNEIDQDTEELVMVLYETTAIRSGYPLEDVNGFTKRVETVIRKGIGASLNAEAKVEVEVAPERTEEEKEKDESFLKMAEELPEIEDEDLYHDEL